MKQKFSKSWIGSNQVRKQRKYRTNAPLHIKHKFFGVNLSKELRKKYGMRNIPIRRGDKVVIMRGNFSKKEGKILSINTRMQRVTIEGINRKKNDGTNVDVYFNPSNLQVDSLNLEDKKRLKKKNITEGKKDTKQEKEDAPNKSESK